MPFNPAWPASVPINAFGDCSRKAPATCVFQKFLYVFWNAFDPSNRIYWSRVPSLGTGYPAQDFTQGQPINGVDATPEAPAACVFQNNLYVFWKANDPGNRIFFSFSTDGQTWRQGQPINAVDTTCSTPVPCVFQNKLFLFWKANRIAFSASTDGLTWPTGVVINSWDGTPNAVATTVFPQPNDPNGKLFIFSGADDRDPSNAIYFNSSADGQSWPLGQPINNVDSTPSAPVQPSFPASSAK
jgi:hypothetical protein